jgi:K+-transporting ATPase ATPase A chain
MNGFEYLQILLFIIALITIAPPLGLWIGQVMSGERHFLSPVLSKVEQLIYKLSGIDPQAESTWTDYLKGLLAFNAIGFLICYTILVTQAGLPLNPQNFANLPWHLAFNTAVSFVTNTNWQSYTGEAALSGLSQMVALSVQNFVSAATGIAVFVALARGLGKRPTSTGFINSNIGNFWVDLTRSTLYILIPLSVVMALVLVSQGVLQNLSGYTEAVTLEQAKILIPQGPVASQIAIKQLGTNGGGYFNANSAHPFENPTPLTNFLEMLAILLIPAALVFTFGRMIKSQKQAVTIFIVMFLVWFFGLGVSVYSENIMNPVTQTAAALEGKETRIGVANSLVWATATTVASSGSVNNMHSSLSPLSGAIAMFNMMLGEVIFGGVGAGMYGMLLFCILTVFLAGLMVGRSPEYLGKRIEAAEIKMALLGILGPCALILIGSAVSSVYPDALSSLSHKGPHGFSEILYAFTSAAANNGSAFGGLNANTPYFNVVLGLVMLVGRFVVIIPALSIAGSMAAKKIAPVSAGSFATDSGIFGILLIGTIIIVGALTFLPALSLGPIVEHFVMLKGQTF